MDAEPHGRMRRTKLICTIGPSSAARIGELVASGMNVARINFSHGSEASHADAADGVRKAGAAHDVPVAIMADLAGPKIRLGELDGGSASLEAGATFRLQAPRAGRAVGDSAAARVSYAGLAKDARVGDPIFLGDGAVELRVRSVDGDVVADVVRGGRIRSRAGVAIPAARMSVPALTSRDRRDAPRAVAIGATFIAQSFVRSAADVAALRRVLGRAGLPIVAKIETRPAVDAFDAILNVVDAVMIARGDLGVELPYEEVPVIQKQLVARARERGVPSIVATQMLESMTAAPRPTRAEAGDVANAVFEGADAILLSGETAIGAYPLEAAEAAGRIIAFAETHGASYVRPGEARLPESGTRSFAVAAVALASAVTSVQAIGCYTRSGRTARMLSSLRPRVPILAFSPDPDVAAQLALAHGVWPRACAPLEASDQIGQLARLVGESGALADGATVALLSSSATPGSAPDVLGIRQVSSRP